jgi:hypothetical protein
MALISALQGSRRGKVISQLALVGAIGIATFALLPASMQARLTTFTGGTTSRAAWAIKYRQAYAAEARRIAAQHPLVGVGVGNYAAASAGSGIAAIDDPHNVVLLEAAEGGYAFAVSFLLLIGGVLLVLRRLRDVELAPVAAGVLFATAMHGLVDVYWVRGTPLLGWLLVGMVCGLSYRKKEERTP